MRYFHQIYCIRQPDKSRIACGLPCLGGQFFSSQMTDLPRAQQSSVIGMCRAVLWNNYQTPCTDHNVRSKALVLVQFDLFDHEFVDTDVSALFTTYTV